MTMLTIRASAGACAAAAAALWLTPAYPHAVCGARIFPTTLAIDDPGVTDELTLPAVTWLPKNSDGTGELDIGGEWAKTIFPNFAISVGSGATWLHEGGYGWDSVETEAKYQFMCIPQLELMASAGFSVEWGGSATGSQVGEPNMYSPVLDVGLGLRRFAEEYELRAAFRDHRGSQHDDAGTGGVGRRDVRHDLQLGLLAAIQPALLQCERRRDRQ